MPNSPLKRSPKPAGVSRATVYRHFPEGRTQVLDDAIAYEVSLFWQGLADLVRGTPRLSDRLIDGLMAANSRLRNDVLLQKLLSTERENLLRLMFQTDPLIHLAITNYVRELLLREHLRPGIDVDHASDYVTRMLVSHIASPGRWDLTDRSSVERLVTTQFLSGILEA